MIEIPGTVFHFVASERATRIAWAQQALTHPRVRPAGVEIEGNDAQGVDFQVCGENAGDARSRG
jgi:hypothetical protein